MDRFIEQIIALLEANMKTARGIKQIYYGNQIIPVNSLPAIIVRGSSNTFQTADNLRDEDLGVIEIILVLESKTYFNNAAQKNSADFNMTKIFEERESGTSHKIKGDTIVGVIQQLFDGDTDYNVNVNDVAVNYDIIKTREFPSLEPTLTITVRSKVYSHK